MSTTVSACRIGVSEQMNFSRIAAHTVNHDVDSHAKCGQKKP
jgi:hypothetical protein